ncbi:MAG: porin [Deltaproteobacteria bacterium]
MRKYAILMVIYLAAFVGNTQADIPVYSNETTRLLIYGRAHGALESYSVEGINSSSDAEGTRLQSHLSRLGFNASQKVTDDIRAVGQVEANVSLFGSDDGSTPFYSTRNTYLGLESKTAGELRFGRHDVAYRVITYKDNLFSDELGENDAIISEGAGRADDTIVYISPKWNDIQFISTISLTDLQEYSSDKLATNSATSLLDKGHTMSAGIQYDGKFGFLGTGFELQESDRLTSTNNANGYDSAVISLGAPKIGGFQIVGAFEIRSGKGKPDEKNYSIGFAQDLGAKWTVKGNYGWKNVDADQANATLLTVGVSYKASNALEFYALCTKLNNEAKSKVDFSDGPIGKTTSASASLTPGDDVVGVALGAIYCF